MLHFEFDNKTKIIFGKETENEVGRHTKQYGKKVLLHYGRNSIKKYGLYDKVVQSLKESNIDFVELGGVQANPRLSLVKQGIELSKREQVDFILAVGGGSVIDSAKAIALGHFYDGDVWDFYSKGVKHKKVLPVGVILTIPAAGSESSPVTVVNNQELDLKMSYHHNDLRPKFAILNPELTYTLPNYQTSCGIVDMMAHVFERYFTKTKNVALTDRLCEGVIKTIIDYAPIVLEDNTNYNSRAEIMWAGAIAHNGILGTGRTEDWASHRIEHQLSAVYDLAHGAGLAIIFPAWMKYVYKQDLNRFALFANKIFQIDINEENLEETALKGIEALEAFYQSIGMPTRLRDVNITDKDFEYMVENAFTSVTSLGQFMKLNKEDVLRIYKLAL